MASEKAIDEALRIWKDSRVHPYDERKGMRAAIDAAAAVDGDAESMLISIANGQYNAALDAAALLFIGRGKITGDAAASAIRSLKRLK